MTEKRYKRLVSSIDYYYCTDNQNENQGLTEKDMLNRLNEQDKEIKNLKKALWESEKAYITETNLFSFDIEKDMVWLKEEFEREYWND